MQGLLVRDTTALLVVDVQERFAPVISDFDGLAAQCARLVEVFRTLELSVLATEQYPQGLGRTVEPLRALLDDPVPEKTSFSSIGSVQIAERIARGDLDAVVVCGIEAHVCVLQTVLELRERGEHVHVVTDAVRSRDGRERDRKRALNRMEHAGAVLTTAETVAFELLRDATDPCFKRIQALFK